MAEDPKWDLAILATVQGFSEKLLQDYVQGELPVPQGLEAISLQQSDGDAYDTLARMRRWLRLLDMATTPAMMRRGLTSDTDPEIAESLLRYLVRKKDLSDANRDKTDLVATFLYRHPRVPGQWERRGYGLDGSIPLPPFEIALLEILADSDAPALTEEDVQLLHRFDSLREEAQSFQDLNALLDSGIIPRVRELKRSLDESFYHPGVLATVAPYNAAFGRKFDTLFHAATAEIRSFAQELQEQGGSILGTVDGVDVTVEHVAAMEDAELLKIDYSTALEKFRRVSQLKRTLERQPPMGRALRPMAMTAAAAASGRVAASAPATARPPVFDLQAMRAAVTPQETRVEETKLRKVEESIRVFVRVADPKFRQVVPMRFFNLTLTPAEASAYCADYLEENSLRADVARLLLRLVALVARITTELEELKRDENLISLCKLHANSLLVLLQITATQSENAQRLVALANEQGCSEQAEAIKTSLEKLRDRSDLVERMLARDWASHS
ncbi:MAG: hypothetical protein LAN63_06445 [Acidobacteriia bacterium]|nr:hypothetical protein [Terriglobia bacterium]